MDNNSTDNTEKYCSVCHRSEKTAGRMLKMPGNTYICHDCMQKMLDAVSSANIDFSNFQGMPFAGMPVTDDVKTASASEDDDIEVIEGEVAEENEKEDEKKKKDRKRITPGISFLNIGDIMGGQNQRPQVKRKKPGEKKNLINPEKILPPHKLKAKLDEYVVGQEHAKKIISVAVYNHYKRVLAGEMIKDEDEVEIEKSNVLMIGPTGSGKTHIVRTLARILDVPLAITDATSLTEAGYIGDDIESVLSKLLTAADNDADRAEVGIVFIDEIDKIAKKNSTRGRDVSGESVQQGLLKMLEGSEIEVPVGSTSKNAMVPMTTINTRNILFICGGAFPDLEDIIKERLTAQSSIGFNAQLKDSFTSDDLFRQVETEDLRKFGMIPEFLGRLPVVCTLEKLSSEMLVKVLKEPKNAILKQYQKLLELDEVELVFEDDALLAITERAAKKDAGARGLRSVIEEVMLDIMYEIPKDDTIGRVTITKDYIEGHGAPIIELRGSDRLLRLIDAPETEAFAQIPGN